MDAFNFDLDTDSTSTASDLDWAAFPNAPSISNLATHNRFRRQEDAVAPRNRATHEGGVYYDIERFFHGLNQQDYHHVQSIPMETAHQRSLCYHKLPEHAVKLMKEWYNAHLDDPYPRSPDKKRFITEGNITAQQCRSWFANRRQRLKHVRRTQQPRTSTIRSQQQPSSSVDEQLKAASEQCYYCHQAAGPPPVTTTVNVVINNQTVEQLIQNSLRKFLYSPEM